MTTARLVLVSTLLAFAAGCEKPSDVAKLQSEAYSTVAKYQPELATLDRRNDEIYDVVQKLPKDLPGTNDAIAARGVARDVIGNLRRATQASSKAITDAAAKENAVAELHKVIDTTNETYERDLRVINAKLSDVEDWVFEQHSAPLPVAAAAMATPPTTP